MSKEEEYLKDLIYSLVTVHLDMGGNNKYALSHHSHKLVDEIKSYLYAKDNLDEDNL